MENSWYDKVRHMLQELLKKYKASVICLGDIVAFWLALYIVLLLRHTDQTPVINYIAPFGIILILWLVIFYIVDLYTYTTFRSTVENAKLYAVAIGINFFLAISIFYIFGNSFGLTPKTNLIIFTAVFAALDGLWRFAFPRLFAAKHAHPLILIGTSPRIEAIIHHAQKHPQWGFKATHIADWNEAYNVIQNTPGDLTVVIDNETLNLKDAHKALYAFLPRHIEIRTLADFYERWFFRIPLEEIEEEWFIRELSESKIYDSGKRAFDIFMAGIGFIIGAPFLIIIAVVVKLTSVGPVFYTQTRVGKDGKLFTLYKFRNMYHTADKNPDFDGSTPTFSPKNDSRVTPFGKFLRSTHLDELGQLINILRGDISFVGPRPERPEFVAELSESIPHYQMRHMITPGLTGWAQIKFRYARNTFDAKEKFEYDLYYLKNRSLLLDLAIIAKTAQYVFIAQE